MKHTEFYLASVRYTADVLNAAPAIGTAYPGSYASVETVEVLHSVIFCNPAMSGTAYRVTASDDGEQWEFFCVVPFPDEEPIRVQFEAGTSRHGDHGVNYMISLPVSGNSFYAEVPVPDGASDDYGYLALKAEILRQAAAQGIDAETLSFWYDGQEQFLEADAADGEATR